MDGLRHSAPSQAPPVAHAAALGRENTELCPPRYFQWMQNWQRCGMRWVEKGKREREREREGEREATTLLGCWLRFDRRRRKKPQCALSLSLFSLFLSLARSLAGFSYFLSRSSGTNEKLHVRMFFLSLYGWLVGWLVVCVSVCALRRRRNSSATSTLRFACLPACLPFCRRS